MSYKKPEIVASNEATQSVVAGCPTNKVMCPSGTNGEKESVLKKIVKKLWAIIVFVFKVLWVCVKIVWKILWGCFKILRAINNFFNKSANKLENFNKKFANFTDGEIGEADSRVIVKVERDENGSAKGYNAYGSHIYISRGSTYDPEVDDPNYAYRVYMSGGKIYVEYEDVTERYDNRGRYEDRVN